MDELDAMRAIYDALDGLDEEQRSRALRWAADLFKINLVGTPAVLQGGATLPDDVRPPHSDVADSDSTYGTVGTEGDSSSNGSAVVQFEHFAELYDACAPKDDTDRAIVAAYWVQIVPGKSQFTGHEVNKELRNLGHGITNVSAPLGRCINKKPALVLQIRKAGKAKQARKTYKLTREGIKAVQAMMS